MERLEPMPLVDVGLLDLLALKYEGENSEVEPGV